LQSRIGFSSSPVFYAGQTLMASRRKPTDPAPPLRSLSGLAEAAQDCKACPLYANATQAVFGEGAARAEVVLVGEQPGDAEDREGHPFVGPAGGVLDRALEQAGITRSHVYVTNAVKHFKWEPRGKRRIHMKPRVSEIKACRPWLEAELTRIKPAVIVCMGTTAVESLLGPGVTIAKAKGQVYETAFGRVVVSRHPSSVLRMREREERQAALQDLVADLKFAARLLEDVSARRRRARPPTS
jgi:DNA polymerase